MLIRFNPNQEITKNGSGRSLRLATTDPNVTVDLMAAAKEADQREALIQTEMMNLLTLAPNGGWLEIDDLDVSPRAFHNPVINDAHQLVLLDGTTCNPKTWVKPETGDNRAMGKRSFFKCFRLDSAKLPSDEAMASLRASYAATQALAFEAARTDGPAVLVNDMYARQRRAQVTQAREAADSVQTETVGLPS